MNHLIFLMFSIYPAKQE